jgi:hypothetical protein
VKGQDRSSKKTKGRAAARQACRDVLTHLMLDALEGEDFPALSRVLRLAARDGRLRQQVRAALDEMDAEEAAPPPGICVIWCEGFDGGGPAGTCRCGPTVGTYAEALAAKAELEAACAGEPGRVALTDLRGVELDVSRAWGEAAKAAGGGS